MPDFRLSRTPCPDGKAVRGREFPLFQILKSSRTAVNFRGAKWVLLDLALPDQVLPPLGKEWASIC
jgi:hypothetical protein